MTTPSLQTLNRVRYAGLDFDTHFDDLRARLQVEFAEDFNDFALSSLGIMLLDLVAYGLDSLSFYLDRRASDAYLATARTRKGVTRLADQLGYKIGASVASSVDLTVALQTAVAFDVTVPKAFQFNGPNDLIFETAQAVTYPAGSGPTDLKVIPCYQGVTFTENFVSDGTANQVFQLRRVPDQNFVVQGTVGVKVNAADWDESDFITFDKTDQFSVSYGDDPPTLNFGDGIAGNIPGEGAAITVTYVASRGKAGQVAAGSITDATTQLVVNFTNIPLTVTQTEASVGGDDTEALSKVKRLAGKVFKSRKVAVTAEDYRALAGSFADPLYGRVASAQAISARSAADDLYLKNAIALIEGYIDPVKLAVNTLTTSQRTYVGTIQTSLTNILTYLGDVGTANTTADNDLSTILTNARDAKNSIVEVQNDATDIVVEAATASGELTAMQVATANLVAGTGTSRVFYLAKVPGQVGASVRVQHLAPPGTLGVTVVNKDITVQLGATSTAADVANAVNLSGPASALVEAYVYGNGLGTAVSQSFAFLGYSSGNSIAVSGLKDTDQALLQQRFDRCKTEATTIQSAGAGVQGKLDNFIIPKALDAQLQVQSVGLNLTTPSTKLYDIELKRQSVVVQAGEIQTLADNIDTTVLVLDMTDANADGVPDGTVAASVGTELKNIFNHVDVLLSADCNANLVSVPILTKNSAGFYVGPTTGLQQALQAYLDARKEVTQTVKVTSGENSLRRPVIVLRVGVRLGYSESVVSAAVQTVVDGVLRDRSFGVSLYVSDIDTEVRDNVEGVAFVNTVISGWNDADSVFRTTELDSDGNLIILPSEVITKEVRTGLSSVTVNTEIVTPT